MDCPEETPVKNRPVPSAMPEAPNAIRVHFDENEPPALVFNELAHPGALVNVEDTLPQTRGYLA
jgi:hypothetical protein